MNDDRRDAREAAVDDAIQREGRRASDDGSPVQRPPADDEDRRLTIDDEIVARARIHARTVELDVDLTRIEWDVSARARRRAGVCRYDADAGAVTIALSRRAYRAYDWEEFAGVVRHELIHAWEFQRFGESDHGPRFRGQAADLDAPLRCPSFSTPRYVLRCTGCEWRARRHRASKPVRAPEHYRCGDCGADYVVEHVASGRTWSSASEYGGVKAALGDQW